MLTKLQFYYLGSVFSVIQQISSDVFISPALLGLDPLEKMQGSAFTTESQY